ncbi:hypothetical protein AVENLUH5627_03574 [Acinetobacter venetianus]|jgi:hypothetical protein|uniref:Uncharacterized protein n=1 Tax=Acinetobacter venetianus TaxID=52133 RepID=A0A150HIZ4_9GAMM|nr:hypothetical protein AVENLUH5627_03574 [Acinetobacter venetianus]KXZ71686.1 hypothetical protein AVENLUH8758_01663 [Acinetobacter venetianus]
MHKNFLKMRDVYVPIAIFKKWHRQISADLDFDPVPIEVK